MKNIVGFCHAKAGTKFIILQSELTKIDLKAYNISGDCTSLYSARFSTTVHKSHSSLSLVLFMLYMKFFCNRECFVTFSAIHDETFHLSKPFYLSPFSLRSSSPQQQLQLSTSSHSCRVEVKEQNKKKSRRFTIIFFFTGNILALCKSDWSQWKC